MAADVSIAAPTGARRTVGWGNRLAAIALVAPAMIVILALFAIPLARLIVESFSQPSWSFHNYTSVITDATTWRIMRITVVIALECTGICVVLGYPVAFLMATLPRAAGRVILIVVLLPFWTSILARMYAWLTLLGRHGAVNATLQDVHVIHSPIQLLYNRIAVLLGMTHYLLPFMILAMYSTMAGIDRSFAQASSSMGATQWQTFRRVYLPLSAPGIYTGSLLVFILALGYYLTPAILGGPQDTTIAVFIQERVSQLEFGQATAMATILLVLVSALFYIYDRYLGLERIFRGIGG